MTAPQRPYFSNNDALNGNVRGCMSSYLTGLLSNKMVYNLVLKTEAKLSQDISRLSARLDAGMQEIRSLVFSALYPTGQHDNNLPEGLRGNAELIQERHSEVLAGPNVPSGAFPHATVSTAADSAPGVSSTSDKRRKQAASCKNDKSRELRGKSKSPSKIQPGRSKRFGRSFSSPASQQKHSGGRYIAPAPQMVGCQNANEIMNVVVKKEPHYCTRTCVYNTGETRWECECGYNTNKKRYMSHHTKAKGLVRFRCPLCPMLLPTCPNVRKHLVNDHKVRRLPTRLLKCRRCYKVFLKAEDKDGHKNERNKICMSRRDRLRKLRNMIEVITLSE